MEVLQQLDTKSISDIQKQSNSLRSSEAGKDVDSANEKPFKEQLNQQMEQAGTRENNKNSLSNQQDKKPDKSHSVVDDDTGAPADNAQEPVQATDEVADSEALKNSIETQTTAAETNTSLATLLPEDGSELPLSGVEVSVTDAELLALTQGQKAVIASQVMPVSEQNTNISARAGEFSQNLSGKSVVDTPVMLSAGGEKTIQAESATVKSQIMAANLTMGQSEKMKIQDAQYSKMLSEVPSADVIAQATRMQKVPMITALSASLAATQNIPAGQNQDIAGVSGAAVSSSTSVQGTALSSSILTAIQNPGWSQQMTQQVAYMIKGGFQQAEIKLNPVHLGPMEIKLSINDDQASVNFVTQHASVRDALDAALPRLKDMLEQQGLNLSDANVSTQSEQQQTSAESHQQARSDLLAEHIAEGEEERPVEHTNVINVEGGSGVSIFA